LAKKNRYTGVLKPLQVGRGNPEVSVVLIYDIEDDRLRTRASEICLDYGLDRIQYSAFFGKLNRNRRQELALKLQREMGAESARIRIIPVCEDDLNDMWVLEQYRRGGEVSKGTGPRAPQLRVLRQDD
jgi:CRISPR-associated protein Cas2